MLFQGSLHEKHLSIATCKWWCFQLYVGLEKASHVSNGWAKWRSFKEPCQKGVVDLTFLKGSTKSHGVLGLDASLPNKRWVLKPHLGRKGEIELTFVCVVVLLFFRGRRRAPGVLGSFWFGVWVTCSRAPEAFG